MRALAVVIAANMALAAPAIAGGDCDLARQVSQLDIASKRLLAETEPARADRIVGRMAADLQALRETNPRSTRMQAGSPAERMQDYIGTREAMVDLYEHQGLPAAKAYLRSGPADAASTSVRDMGALLDCGGESGERPGAGTSAAGAGQQQAHALLGRLTLRRGSPAAAFSENRFVPIVAALLLAAVSVATALFLNRRRYVRHACDIPALLMIRNETIFGHVANISRGGAKIRATNEIQDHPRGAVLFEDGRSLPCKVIWSNSHFIGVTFHPKLTYSPRTLIDALGQAPPEAAMQATRM